MKIVVLVTFKIIPNFFILSCKYNLNVCFFFINISFWNYLLNTSFNNCLFFNWIVLKYHVGIEFFWYFWRNASKESKQRELSTLQIIFRCFDPNLLGCTK